MNKTNVSKIGKVLAVSIFILVVFFISMLLLWEILKFTFIFKTFDYVVKNIVNVSGMSSWLAKGLVIFLMIPFFWALGEIFKIRFRFNLFRKKQIRSYRKLALVTAIAYIGFFFLSMFFLSRGTYFSHMTGQEMKWYAETPEGLRFFDSSGFDPKYGIKLKPVTSDMMIKVQKKMMGMQPKRVEIETLEGFEFFDTITGEPKYWYHIDNDGNWDFFERPGYHPIYNIELKPVTPEIVKAYQNRLKEEQEKKAAERERLAEEQKKRIEEEKAQQFIAYLNKYINLSVINQLETKEISVLILDEELKERWDVEQRIALFLKKKELNPVFGLFKYPFIKDGTFGNIFSGDTVKIKELQLEKNADYLILGKKLSSFKKNPELLDLVSAEVKLELKIFSTEKGVIINSTLLSAVGSGFSNSEAERNAIELLCAKIDNFLREVF